MALPSIQFDRSMVQDPSRSIAAVGAAQRQALDTVSAGLQALGQEMVKTQNQRAAADFEEGLARIEGDLAAKKYFTTQEVKEQLGQNFDSLPPEVRGQLTKKTVNPASGEEVELDRTDIPAWVVAGAIYDKRAREVARSSSEAISVPGWQAEFEQQAQREVVTRKARINEQQMHAMVADQKDQQRAIVDKFTRLGLWDDAIRTIDQSNAWMPGEKSALAENVLAAKARATVAQERVAQAAQVEAKGAEIIAKVTLPGYGWVDPAKAQEAIDAIPADDPNKDGVRKLVEHQVMRSEQLRERAGKDMLNRAQSMLAQGVPLEGAQMAGVKAWMLDPANGAAGEWGTLERMVRSEERSARIERNSRLADDRRATADARRDAADAARKDKEQQDAHDQEALNGFDDLDPKEQAETDLRAKYPDVDPKGKAFAKLADRKRKAAAALAKDQGVNVTEFKAKVESTALKLGYSKKDTAAFRTQMLDSYLSRADPTTPVLPAEADVMLAEAVVYADVSMGRDVPAWKLRMQGKDVKVAADQPERVRAVVGAPAPAKTGKVRVTGPGGRTGMADEKGLDDWLKAHPGWSR